MISLLIFGVGLAAGFVDAIAGGGGLIMLPGLLFAGLPVSSAIATNKLCGTFGALTSTLKFAHSRQIDWRVCAQMSLPIIAGSYIGSRSIDRLPTDWAEPIVIALIVAITTFIVLNPSFGTEKKPASTDTPSPPETSSQTAKHPFKPIALSLISGAAIGFHDGFFGPGTGIFLVFSLLSIRSIDFLKATGTTKLLNFLANITALITFALSGNIVYSLGLFGAAGVITGSYIGASFAAKKGATFIRPIFIVVTTALVIKLAVEYFAAS